MMIFMMFLAGLVGEDFSISFTFRVNLHIGFYVA